jgi:hypothetical protein
MRDPESGGLMGIADFETAEDRDKAVRRLDKSEFRNPFDTAVVRVEAADPGDDGAGGRAGARVGPLVPPRVRLALAAAEGSHSLAPFPCRVPHPPRARRPRRQPRPRAQPGARPRPQQEPESQPLAQQGPQPEPQPLTFPLAQPLPLPFPQPVGGCMQRGASGPAPRKPSRQQVGVAGRVERAAGKARSTVACRRVELGFS